jgi:hypothetical protein
MVPLKADQYQYDVPYGVNEKKRTVKVTVKEVRCSSRLNRACIPESEICKISAYNLACPRKIQSDDILGRRTSALIRTQRNISEEIK